jgi:hypothetical protein
MSTATIPVRVAEQVLCAHCTLPVPEGLLEDDAERQFCCSGCHTAFGILHAHGLDSYYGFTDRRESPVRASGRSYDEFDHPAFANLYVTALPTGLSRTELYLEGGALRVVRMAGGAGAAGGARGVARRARCATVVGGH